MFLIVGGDSEIGAAAYRAMQAQGAAAAATTRHSDRVAPDRPFLDLAAPLDGWVPPPETQAVCLCAAMARLAACADDPEGSAHVNVVQTLALVEQLLARGIAVLFLSTNQVFDGRTPLERAEAPHSPVSEYGRQKARAEAALLRQMDNGAPVAILRLAKVVSDTMPLIGGFGSAVTDVLVEKLGASLPALVRIGLPDAFPHKYGLQEELFEVYGLAPAQIAARVAKSLKVKDKVA